MVRRRAVVSAFVLALLAAPSALAQGAPVASTPAQAPKPPDDLAALRRTLETYLTPRPFERGLLRLDTDPAGQRLTLDPAPLLSDLLGSPVRVRPFRLILAERPDGDWDVSSDDPVEMEWAVTLGDQTRTVLYSQESQSYRGVFSPSLGAFSQGELKATGTRNEESAAASRSVSTIGATTLTTRASANPAGGADVAVRQTYADISQTSSTELPAGTGLPAGSLDFGALTRSAVMEGRIEGLRTLAIRDLYVLVLRHADALEVDPRAALAGPFGAELVAALGRVLPLWTGADISASARSFRITSPYGEASVGDVRQDARFSGVQSDAGFEIDVAVQDLAVSSPLLPPWAGDLVPRELTLGFALSGVDLAEPAAIALREVDFRRDPPLSPDARTRLVAALRGENLVGRIKPSRVRAAGFDVAFSGEMRLAGMRPAARLAADMGGIDALIATLRTAAAERPDLFQAVGVLQFAKGVGRARPDGRLEWIVEAGADGSVRVNGTMLKGPDPAPAPGGGAPAGSTDL